MSEKSMSRHNLLIPIAPLVCQVKWVRVSAWSPERLMDHYFVYACHCVLAVSVLCPEKAKKIVMKWCGNGEARERLRWMKVGAVEWARDCGCRGWWRKKIKREFLMSEKKKKKKTKGCEGGSGGSEKKIFLGAQGQTTENEDMTTTLFFVVILLPTTHSFTPCAHMYTIFFPPWFSCFIPSHTLEHAYLFTGLQPNLPAIKVRNYSGVIEPCPLIRIILSNTRLDEKATWRFFINIKDEPCAESNSGTTHPSHYFHQVKSMRLVHPVSSVFDTCQPSHGQCQQLSSQHHRLLTTGHCLSLSLSPNSEFRWPLCTYLL